MRGVKASTDTATHEQELADAEVVHQPELIVSKRAPRICDRNGSRGQAAIRVALVHGDAAEIVLEDLHGIEHGPDPTFVSPDAK